MIARHTSSTQFAPHAQQGALVRNLITDALATPLVPMLGSKLCGLASSAARDSSASINRSTSPVRHTNYIEPPVILGAWALSRFENCAAAVHAPVEDILAHVRVTSAPRLQDGSRIVGLSAPPACVSVASSARPTHVRTIAGQTMGLSWLRLPQARSQQRADDAFARFT